MKERGIFLKRFRKVLIVLLAILVPVSIGFGFNFFSGESSDSAENQAMTVAGKLSMNEVAKAQNLVPGDKICNGINMEIKSSAVSLLRVKVDLYYGDINGDADNLGKDVLSIKGIDNTKWKRGSDGYYYYMDGVDSKDNLTFGSGIYFEAANKDAKINDYQNKKIKVVANAELIQAKYGVFKDAWGLDQDVDKDIYNKLLAVPNTENNTIKSE